MSHINETFEIILTRLGWIHELSFNSEIKARASDPPFMNKGCNKLYPSLPFFDARGVQTPGLVVKRFTTES